MSEKKEYIGIFKTSDVKINGKDYIAKIPAGGSELYTRAEAVERMGTAILEALNPAVSFDRPWEQIKKEMAEAALAALLEDKQ